MGSSGTRHIAVSVLDEVPFGYVRPDEKYGAAQQQQQWLEEEI
jgi:hypothetical protein